MTEEIKNILLKIDELEKFKNDSQKVILDYCKNKLIPLKERWKVWEKYCFKQEEGYIIESEDFEHPLLKYVCKVMNDNDNDRGREIDYTHFISKVEWFDKHDYKKVPALIRDIKISNILSDTNSNVTTINKLLVSVLKEAIIEENFGSYTFDW